MRARLLLKPMHRGQLPALLLPPRSRGRPPKTERPPCPSPSGNPITIMSPARSQPEVVDRDKHGHPRAHNADSASPASLSNAPRSALRAALRVTGRRSWRSHTTRWPSPPGHPNDFTNRSLTRPDCTDKRNSGRSAVAAQSADDAPRLEIGDRRIGKDQAAAPAFTQARARAGPSRRAGASSVVLPNSGGVADH